MSFTPSIKSATISNRSFNKPAVAESLRAENVYRKPQQKNVWNSVGLLGFTTSTIGIIGESMSYERAKRKASFSKHYSPLANVKSGNVVTKGMMVVGFLALLATCIHQNKNKGAEQN